MSCKAKRVRLFNEDRTQSVPALIIPVDEYTVVVEAAPADFQRQRAFGGRSRIYFLGADYFETVDEVTISERVWSDARTFVYASLGLHAAASKFGPLGSLLE